MKTNEFILNLIAVICLITIFLMAFIFILLHHTDSSATLKDTWTVFGGYFGGFATLTAAYIASKLFNDWRDLHNKQIYKDLALRIKKNSENLDNNLILISYEISRISELLDKKDINLMEASRLMINQKRDLMMSFKDLSGSSFDLFYVFAEKINSTKLNKFNDDFLSFVEADENNHDINKDLINLKRFVFNMNQIHDEYRSEVIKIIQDIRES